MKIPWAKPAIGKAEREAVMDCFERDWLTMGPKVAELEKLAAAMTGSPHCIAVNSGTAALDVALKLAGVGPADEVIIPALSYIATGASVLYQQATPVFVDIDPQTFTLDVAQVEEAVTGRTRAIIAIDYAGHPAAWQPLADIAGHHGLTLIEDGAPGLGGRYQGAPLCARAEIGITSFHMAKTLSAVEGGMVFVNSAEHESTARMMRSQGEDPDHKYTHPVLGHNYRMSDLHAAVGVEQLKKADAILGARRRIADFYSRSLAGVNGIHLPTTAPGCEHAWFLFPVRLADRDRVRAEMSARGIETNVSWPMPIYRQAPFTAFERRECPVTERFTREVLCLPMYFGMTEEEMQYVSDNLREIVG